MKCSDARFALAADPRNGDAMLLDHLESCPSCAAYAVDMHELDRQLKEAMQVPVPDRPLPSGPYAVPASDVRAGGTPVRRRSAPRFALAASLAGLALATGLLWSAFPRQSLASAVVEHMAHEPASWEATSPLPAADLQHVVSRSGIRLDARLPDVTYANSCWFRGHFVPHLVVRTPGGAVTVLVLPRERIDAPARFDEDGYRGTLVPAPRGSIAVIARDGADVEQVATAALAAISYVD